MDKKPKRPAWFKLWLNQKPLIDAVPDDVAGRALKAAYQYLAAGEIPELDSLTGAVFAVLKSQIDEAIRTYNVSVESGIVGANKRWRKDAQSDNSPPIAPYSPPTPPIGEHAEDRSKKIEDNNISCSFAIRLLNELSGSSFRDTTKTTQRLIHARKNEGYTLADIEMVIRHKCSQWGNDKQMRQYLRPQTLFGSKFESYLSDAKRNEPNQEAGYTLAPVDDPWDSAVREGSYV